MAFAATAVSIGVAAQGPPAAHFDHLSNTGDLVGDLSARDVEMLTHSGATADVRQLGVAGDVAFYESPSVTGAACFAIGLPQRGLGVGAVACPPQGGHFSFPSDEHPIFDMSFTSSDPDRASTSVAGLVGFAADGVASVGVIGTDGRLAGTTPVQNNLYLRRWAAGVDATAIVALDDSGAEVYRQQFPAP